MRIVPLLVALVVVVAVAAAVAFALDRRGGTTTQSEATPTLSSPKSSPTTMPAPADAISAEEVVLKTELGDIRLMLFPVDAPNTVRNFATLGKRGYYSDVIFHRVLRNFMIQGGDPTGTGSGGESIYGAKFGDEFNQHKVEVGSIAMANAGPATNGSQFFIVTEQAQPHLDGRHTVFGKVADDASMTVVRDIAAQEMRTEPQFKDRGVPVDPVKITGFEIVK